MYVPHADAGSSACVDATVSPVEKVDSYRETLALSYMSIEFAREFEKIMKRPSCAAGPFSRLNDTSSSASGSPSSNEPCLLVSY